MLHEELRQAQQSLVSWQESWKQAKAACEAWKKEAEEATSRTRLEREGNMRRIEEVRTERERGRGREGEGSARETEGGGRGGGGEGVL